MPNKKFSDRGTSLISYALLVGLISMVAMVGVSYAGSATADSFDELGQALASTLPTEPELTPEEKWELAQAEYDKAVDDAKTKKAADLDTAKDTYQQALDDNKSLPKADRPAANQTAKDTYNDAKAQANSTYTSSVNSAKAKKDAAKAAYKASK